MSKDYTQLERSQVRRDDRQVSDETWIRELLHQAPVANVATVYDGQPFINVNLFVYDEERQALYLHTARKGRTRANVESNDEVCVSISHMGRLLPAGQALEFSVEYASVIVFGRIAVVAGAAEEERGLQLLMDKYAPHLKPGRDYEAITAAERKRTSLYRIDIDEWSGKQKKVATDFPGAYFYEQLKGLRRGPG